MNLDLELANLALDSYDFCNVSDGNIEALVKRDDRLKEVNIGLRGTHKNKSSWSLIRDIITDIRFYPRNHPNIGRVPSGFLDGAILIADDITRITPKGFTYNLTGHSLGGVLAEIVGALLVVRGFNVKHIRTFGAPAGGKLEALSYVDVVGYRYGRDIVTTLPPFMPRHRKAVRIGPKGGPFTDHSMLNYRKEIRNNG